MWKESLAIFTGAALAGGIIGRKSVEEIPPTAAHSRESIITRGAFTPKWSNDDFLNSVRERSLRAGKGYTNPLAGKLADWTDQEIVDALSASLGDPDFMLRGGPGEGVANFLLAEWMRRDFTAALSWFDQLEPRSVKSSLILKIGNLWPADKSEEGLAFVRANLAISSKSDPILVNAFGNRAKQGVGEVVELLKIMREEKIRFDVSLPIEFPADFDFPALVASDEFQALWDRQGSTMFIRGWYAQDKDAAFDWLLENHGVKSLSSNFLVPSAGNYQEHLQWLGGKIETLDAAERGEYVARNVLNWLRSPNSLDGIAKGITDPVLLDEIRAIGVKSIHGGKTREALSLLEGIEDPARRIEILETTPPPNESEKRFLDRRFEQLDEVLLRKKLAGWNAPPERIEAIITRFKP